ncbi:MAG: hypothetical protein E7624_02515 [Ruminococcaceae bacterium]|nr:hypothetical protein [Oscillospiraceae bacterium]
MSFHEFLHVLLHALQDSAVVLPFLFLTYLLMELLEHKAGDGVEKAIKRAGRVGPLWGGALGLVPQCGFSALAAGFYAGRVVSVGTLLAVFLATSDEMIPVFLGARVSVSKILIVLGLKLIVAVAVGFLCDLLLRHRAAPLHVEGLCEEEHCHCEKGVLRSSLHHTVHVFLFILLVNVALGFALELLGEARLAAFMQDIPVLGQLIAALVGLIPNCAASVAVATLYVKGVISAGAMLAGLLTGAGAGLLVLFRTNRHLKENLQIVVILLLTGVLFGTLLDLTGLAGALGL